MKTKVLLASAGFAAVALAYAPVPVVFDTPASRQADLPAHGVISERAGMRASKYLHISH